MAPKRSAPPPPPHPPAASDDETASGSGSEEEEEEDEEEIAHSPPPAAPKSVAPPPQEDQESEASDEDEDGDEEDDDEEEEHEKTNHVIPSALKTPPPPTREESETSDEEEEEEEEEEAGDKTPQTKPAPNQEVEAKGAKRPSGAFQRTWSTDDEIRILEALAAHRLEHDTLPQTEVLANALAGKLDNSGCSVSELQRKVRSLHSRISKAVKKGAPPSKDDRRLFDLFKNVWPSVTKAPAPKAAAPKKAAAAANSGAGRKLDEMCELYPYLAEEVQALQKANPGLFKREFAMIDDSKARALDEKIKKQRHVRLKLHMRRHDLIKEVTKTLADLTE